MMSEHWKNFLDGVRQVLVLMPEDEYLRPQRGDCLTDYHNLRSDAGQIAKDLRKILKKQKYGQTHEREST